MARFPLTAAALEHEAEALASALFEHPVISRKIEELIMASVKDLKDALEGAKASVDSLTAKVGQSSGGIDPDDLDPVLAEITELHSTVEALSSSITKPVGPAA